MLVRVPVRNCDVPRALLVAVYRFGSCRATESRRIDEQLWRSVLGCSELVVALPVVERSALRQLAGRFLASRRVVGARGLVPEPLLGARIAAEAALLLLHLPDSAEEPLAPFASVREIIVYPEAFVVDQRWTDEFGVEHERTMPLAGEAWDGGPVVLAKDDVESPQPGFNVVLHEFAHVLDAGNGRLNGFPPMRDPELRAQWPIVFDAAWSALSRAEHRARSGPIDAYALEDPAEFFAVCTESFFTDAATLASAWPDVYDCLRRYYGQSPIERA